MKRFGIVVLVLMVFAVTAYGAGKNLLIEGNKIRHFDGSNWYTLSAPSLSGTLATTGGTETLTNKTISGATLTTGVLYPAEVTTATNALTAAECGKTIYLDFATEFTTTLPALSTVSAGCEFAFELGLAPSGNDYVVNTTSLETGIIGTVFAASGNSTNIVATGSTMTFVDGQAIAGDGATVKSDGTSWFARGFATVPTGLVFN